MIIEAAALGGRLRELHVLRPDRMKVIPGPDGWPEGFEYTAAGTSVRIGGEPVPGVRAVLHLRLFHPANDHYGLSPIEAEANRAFWRQTVLPLVRRLARGLGLWLAPAWGGDLRLVPDLDERRAR